MRVWVFIYAFTCALSFDFYLVCLLPAVLVTGRTDDRVAAGRLLQHGRQRSRPALRLLGGDRRFLGLHQGPGKRPLHPPSPALSGAQAW